MLQPPACLRRVLAAASFLSLPLEMESEPEGRGRVLLRAGIVRPWPWETHFLEVRNPFEPFLHSPPGHGYTPVPAPAHRRPVYPFIPRSKLAVWGAGGCGRALGVLWAGVPILRSYCR